MGENDITREYEHGPERRLKVTIHRDRDGWHYHAGDLRSAAFASYPLAHRSATSAGHDVDNAGWRHRLLSWNFSHHAIDGYPEWELDGEHPAFVKLTHTRGTGDVESAALANEWDDIAAVDFYQRDWTDDGIPFVREGETYWSGWWFATIAERDRFVAWQGRR